MYAIRSYYVINNGTALLATLFLAFLLWQSSGVETYNLVVLIGIASGIGASALLYKLPDPSAAGATPERRRGLREWLRDAVSPRVKKAASESRLSPDGAEGPVPEKSLFAETRAAWKDRNFRRFVLSYLVLGVGIGMVRP